jgi:competence protein ComGC
MKMPSTKTKVKAFTLVESLVVIFLLAFLAAMLLPSLAGRGPTYNIRCVNNQRQIGIGIQAWKNDYGEQFPWQVSSTNGGTLEQAERG